jgi:hypothetical protein
VIAAQSLVPAEQPAKAGGQARQRGGLAIHHVRIEIRRPPHRLAGVVDDEVESRPRREELAAEGLDARRVAQIEAEDLEPVLPVGKVGLAGVALRGVTREARGDDEMRARAQQLEPRLITNLDAAARQQRDTTAKVGQLGPFRKIERRACGTQLIVEVMNDRILLLADVAVLRFE